MIIVHEDECLGRVELTLADQGDLAVVSHGDVYAASKDRGVDSAIVPMCMAVCKALRKERVKALLAAMGSRTELLGKSVEWLAEYLMYEPIAPYEAAVAPEATRVAEVARLRSKLGALHERMQNAGIISLRAGNQMMYRNEPLYDYDHMVRLDQFYDAFVADFERQL